MKNFFFQPEYVSRFKCDGTNCGSNCCTRPWNIVVDEATYEKFSRLGEREILDHINFHAGRKQFLLERPCPFLTAQGLCGLQLERGENFLPADCATYPRVTRQLGKIFEQSLTLTCPVAAEMILFEREPMKFEFVAVEDERFGVTPLKIPEKFLPHVVDIQIALISILQERTLSIDQRLIVLGFFFDRLEEIFANPNEDALTKFLAAYESKKFFASQVPLMIQSVHFDGKNFVRLISDLLDEIYGDGSRAEHLEAVITDYENLRGDRKIFAAQYSTFLENYLVNEIFMNCYPWRFTETISDNFAIFAATYKIFELMMFSSMRAGFKSKADLLKFVDWFTVQIDHTPGVYEKIFRRVKKIGDTFALLETLTEN